MIYCTVCMNNNRSKKNISYFHYPKDRSRRIKWLNAVGREDLASKLSDDDKKRQQFRICEEHFEKNCIIFARNMTRKYLSDKAFPRLNLPTKEGTCSSSNQFANESPNVQLVPTTTQPGYVEIVEYVDNPGKILDNTLTTHGDFSTLSDNVTTTERLSIQTISDDEEETSKIYFKSCSVFGCNKNSRLNDHITYFHLPADEERRNYWLTLIQHEDTPLSNPLICEAHFAADSIIQTSGQKILKKDAVPTLLLPSIVKKEDTGIEIGLIPAEECADIDILIPSDPLNTFASHENKLLDKLPNIENEQAQTTQDDNTRAMEYKVFCYNLYHASREAYNSLKDTLDLPSPSSFDNMHVTITTHVDNHLMEALRVMVAPMNPAERNCSLVISVIKLKKHFFYNDDKIFGFHEVCGVQKPEPANYAAVAMVRSFCADLKQPIGYALLVENKNHGGVWCWTDSIIRRLFDIGLNVRVLISDLDINFFGSDKRKVVTEETPYFFVGDKKIYYIYDVPSLFTSVRDHLMLYDFQFGNGVAKWEHIQQFYDGDKVNECRLANKLTDSHLKPNKAQRQRVDLAAQVFSGTVAAGMTMYRDFEGIDQSADATIKLITMMNNLFDILNSISRHGSSQYQHAFTGEEYQVSFLNEILNFLHSLKLIKHKSGVQHRNRKITFIYGFPITIKAVMFLFQDLNAEGCTHMLTRMLNQECLKDFFDTFENSKNPMKPTAYQLVSGLRKEFFLNIVKKLKDKNYAENVFKAYFEADQKLHENQETGHNMPTISSVFSLAPKSELNVMHVCDIKNEPSEQDNNTNEIVEKNIEISIKQEVTDETINYYLGETSNNEKNDNAIQIKSETDSFIREPKQESNIDINEIGDSHYNEFNVICKSEENSETEEKLEIDSDVNYIAIHSDDNKSPENTNKEETQEKDSDNELQGVASFAIANPKGQSPSISTNTSDFSQKYRIITISGNILERCLVMHKNCSLMESYVENIIISKGYDRYIEYCTNGGRPLQIIPNDNFIEFIESLKATFDQFFNKSSVTGRILQTLINIVKKKNISFNMPCYCFPIHFCIRFYLQLEIENAVDQSNRAFKRECPETREPNAFHPLNIRENGKYPRKRPQTFPQSFSHSALESKINKNSK